MTIVYRNPKDDTDEISKVLINRYCKATGNTVVRFERKNLKAIEKLVYPRHIEMLTNENATFAAGYIVNDADLFDHHLLHKGNYVIKDWRGCIYTATVDTMAKLCQRFG